VLLLVGLLDIGLSGPPWTTPAICAGAVALVLAAVGIVLSRSLADAIAGGVIAGCALPYAFVAGLLMTAPSAAHLLDVGAPGLLLGSAMLIVFGVICYTTVAATLRIFVAAIGAGAAGAVAALLSMAGVSTAGSAAIVLTAAIGLLPGYPLIARALGGLPVPTLPARPEEILEDRPLPPREHVFAAVARANELLSGMLQATALVSVCAMAVLAAHGGTPARVLTATAGAALLLRARLFPTPLQRVPLIASGVLAVIALVIALILDAGGAGGRLLLLLVIAAAAAATVAGGLVYSRRAPSPRMGRTADIIDVLAILALVPLACAVAGIFHEIQGLFASVGG
jgi:type VII secretion integral membrane protein EccD